MKVSLFSLLTLAPAAVLAQNSSNILPGLVAALQHAGLTQTIQVAASLNGTATGLQIISNITNGLPHLIFAPTDDACKSLTVVSLAKRLRP